MKKSQTATKRPRVRMSFFGAAEVSTDEVLRSDEFGEVLQSMTDLMRLQRTGTVKERGKLVKT